MFSTEVRQDSGRNGAVLSARAAISVEGSRLVSPGEIEQPTVVSIQSEDGRHSADGSSLLLAGAEGLFIIRVLVPEDTAVTVDTRVLTDQ